MMLNKTDLNTILAEMNYISTNNDHLDILVITSFYFWSIDLVFTCTIINYNIQILIPRAGVWCLLTPGDIVKKWYCYAVTCGCLQFYDKQTFWIWDRGTMGPSMELKGPKNNCNDRCTEIVKFNIDWYLKKKSS